MPDARRQITIVHEPSPLVGGGMNLIIKDYEGPMLPDPRTGQPVPDPMAVIDLCNRLIAASLQRIQQMQASMAQAMQEEMQARDAMAADQMRRIDSQWEGQA